MGLLDKLFGNKTQEEWDYVEKMYEEKRVEYEQNNN